MSEPDRAGGAPASVTVAHLSPSQRDMLWMRLRGDDVPFSLSGDTVSAPQRCADDLREAVRWVTNDLAPMPIDYVPPRPLHREDDEGNVVASRTKRLLGWWLDSLIGSFCYLIAYELGVSAWFAFAVIGAYVICCTYLFGRTIGKHIVGIEVVDADHENRVRISWSRSAVRWGATVAIGVIAGLLESNRLAELVLLVSPVVFYAPILWDPRGQGVHDRLARTVVLQRRIQNDPR